MILRKKFDVVLLIGRFQPYHLGHDQIVRSANQIGDRVVILVGSANIGRDTRNPFNVHERMNTIVDILTPQYPDITGDDDVTMSQFYVDKLDDHPYDNAKWIAQVQEKVATICSEEFGLAPGYTVAITGHERDESSFYLKKFPQWTFVPPKTDIVHMNATAVRRNYLLNPEASKAEEWKWLPRQTIEFMDQFSRTPEFEDLAEELKFEDNYKVQWGPGPFQTVDNVVVQSGHVLVVERKKRPGRGRLAIPGGHLELTETCDEGAVRELWEETRLTFPEDEKRWAERGVAGEERRYEGMKKSLWPHYRARRRFDHPSRSRRARVITEAFLFKLPDGTSFPSVVGSDDAARAFWMPLSEVKPEIFFEDHGFIIQKMLGYLS